MSDNLFGDRYAGREIAWHRLGKVKPEGWDSCQDAFIYGRLNYMIQMLALGAQLPDSSFVMVPKKFGIYREPTKDDPAWQFLGVCGSGYQVVQNMELAELIDRLGLPKKWAIETVGALGNGETIFLTMETGEYEVAGIKSEALKLYFLVTDTRDALSSMQFAFTPVRVVCKNTLVSGLKSAKQLTKVRHHKGVGVEVQDRIRLMAGLDKAITTTLESFEFLAKTKISSSQVKRVIAEAYPFPTLPARLAISQTQVSDDQATSVAFTGNWAPEAIQTLSAEYNREVERIGKIRDGAVERYLTFNDQQPEVAHTSWALYNAIVEHEDYRPGPTSLYASTLWGARAQVKERAFAELVAINPRSN